MRGNINKQMTQGIDGAASVVVFVTKRYITKANGDGPNGEDDNCKFEFDYSLRRKGVAKMVAVVMEPSCRNTNEWSGTVGGKLGGLLYTDLADDGQVFENNLQRLVMEIQALTEKAKPVTA